MISKIFLKALGSAGNLAKNTAKNIDTAPTEPKIESSKEDNGIGTISDIAGKASNVINKLK